jgi:transposase InsO family protein
MNWSLLLGRQAHSPCACACHKRGVGRADHAAKLALATPVSGTTGARDAIAAVKVAIREAERLLGHSLLKDCIDPVSGEITPLTIVTDNGPAYKSTDFARFIASRPELAHVRTRHHSPETNGVVERFNGSIKYEHLFGRRQRPLRCCHRDGPAVYPRAPSAPARRLLR